MASRYNKAMIGYFSGEIKFAYDGWLILDVSGVGYRINIPHNRNYCAGKKSEFYTHTHVREDILSLYGFDSLEELNFFEMLISVSGIGPKVALAIISSAPVDRLKSSIANGDPGLLSSVSGVGKKTAEKAVVELKSRLKIGHEIGSSLSSDSSDVYEALHGLGFGRPEIAKALFEIRQQGLNTEEKIKLILKKLGKC